MYQCKYIIKDGNFFIDSGYFGNLLYTGDFRFCDSMLREPALKQLAEDKTLGLLYVDNTYEYIKCDFPSRQNAVHEVIRTMRSVSVISIYCIKHLPNHN